MKSKTIQDVIDRNRAIKFAWKFIADHRIDEGGEHILSSNVHDLSDKHLEETFKYCVIPLKPIHYELCRNIIKGLIINYKIV